MTYLEKATSADHIIEYSCPDEYLGDNYPSLDERTYSSDVNETGKRGCRGITCEQCWNTEISKGMKK